MDTILTDMDGVIAGTEPYKGDVIKRHAGRLKVIARVGIGLDNVELPVAREAGVAVTYTPEAPSRGVAELAVGQMIALARHVYASDRSVREGAWNRLMGWLLSERRIGLLGLGRIGKLVYQLLQPFGAEILACDIAPDLDFVRRHNVKLVPADELFRQCDLVSVHIPLNKRNRHFVNREKLALMKTGSFLINTARGPVVDEEALTDALLQKHLGGAALDVFEKEPYEGVLTELDNVVLTAHMGASARRCRKDMEFQATEDCIRVLKGEPPLRPVPPEEYDA
jgi:D-3-phosphoglycerate dehydrogenase